MTPIAQRVAVGLEYDGTDFVGWQVQREGRSVQGVLEAAVSAVADERTGVTGAGRTDAGVHARCQVAHFDTRAQRTSRQWLLGINSNLPEDVALRWVRPLDADFHARRSATARRYRYRILERGTRSALLRRRSWWRRGELDCAAMTAAAGALLGERDFSSFRAAGCQSRTRMRRLTTVALYRAGGLLHLEFEANAFLQHMVRNLVGVLVEVGQGRRTPGWAAEVLAARDRARGGVTAPPQGLTLAGVRYPARFGLPPLPRRSRGWSDAVTDPQPSGC